MLRAGLVSDNLRAITPFEIHDVETFQASLREAGIQGVRVERVEPTLEDVFLALSDLSIMEGMNNAAPRFLLVGRLSRDYIIIPDQEPLIDIPGGNALYAAVGLAVWEPDPPPAILARVGEDYPQEWLDNFGEHGLDVRGVRILSEAVDLRFFAAFLDRNTRSIDDPVAHFARLGKSFPKVFAGLPASAARLWTAAPACCPSPCARAISLRELMDATAVHLCPLDYLTHSLLPAVLRQKEFTTVTLDPSPGYMNNTFWGDVPALLTGLTAFLPSEEEVRSLYRGRSNDLWEMAEGLAAYGCEIIVIKCGEQRPDAV